MVDRRGIVLKVFLRMVFAARLEEHQALGRHIRMETGRTQTARRRLAGGVNSAVARIQGTYAYPPGHRKTPRRR